MRQVLVATLVLLPVLAHAQASTATGAPQSTPSANLQAKVVVQPVNFVRAAATPAAAPAPAPSAPRDVVQADVDPNFLQNQTQPSGSLSYTFLSGASQEAVAPKLIHAVGRQIPVDRLTTNNDVAVRFVVSPDGVPEKLTIAKSAGAEMDEKTLEAVRQYRFKPATLNNRPVEAEVTVEVKVQNQK